MQECTVDTNTETIVEYFYYWCTRLTDIFFRNTMYGINDLEQYLDIVKQGHGMFVLRTVCRTWLTGKLEIVRLYQA